MNINILAQSSINDFCHLQISYKPHLEKSKITPAIGYAELFARSGDDGESNEKKQNTNVVTDCSFWWW